jgi:hypothetical protein
LRTEQQRAQELASDDRARLEAMREHNAGFVTVSEPTTPKPVAEQSSRVARTLSAVAQEKQISKQKQRRRDDDERIAREALRNLAS